jgi:hypothetical protein
MSRRVLVVGCLVAAGVVAYLLFRGDTGSFPPLTPTFDGSSDQLRNTAIVPTLDSPISEGKSAVWCGSIQLAWNDLKSNLAGGPVRVAGAEVVAGRLNASPFTDRDLSPGTYYAAAGLVRDGILDKIRADMARQFPDAPAPRLDGSDVAVAYAYLQASVPFRLPYYEDRLTFRGADGRETAVRAFGIRKQEEWGATELRDQVGVLFADGRRDEDGWQPTEYAVDLCRDSSPDQVVVAMILRQPTLGEMIAEVKRRTMTGEKAIHSHEFGKADHLLVPAMAWRVEHRFAELEGPQRRLSGGTLDGLYIDRALQVVQFRLDKSGADLKSEAGMSMKGLPRHFHFDRPYLITMARRGAEHPYFAMWVDNDELMAR